LLYLDRLAAKAAAFDRKHPTETLTTQNYITFLSFNAQLKKKIF